MENSAFIKKFWNFSNTIPPKIIKFFKNCLLFNSDKCRQVEYTDRYTLAGIKPDDLYLYNLCHILKKKVDKCIITTDKPLIEVFRKKGLKIKHRMSF